MEMRFGLLGPLRVEADGIQQEVTGPKVRLLLAVLLLSANRALTVDRLLDLLWEQEPPRTANSALHNHAARLRQALGADGACRLRSTASGYVLTVRPGELDTEEFTVGAERAQRAWLRRDWPTAAAEAEAALALWRGEPFADVLLLADSPEGVRLRELRLQLLEWRFDACLHLGRHQNVIAELTSLVAEHPTREWLHRQLMLALHATARTAEALDVYHSLRRTLAEELGVDPGKGVRDAYQKILETEPTSSAAAPAPSSAPFQLPYVSSDFIGRYRELELLTTALRAIEPTQPRVSRIASPLVVISGMGGIGKTALAVRAAHQMREQYPDGQLFADMQGFGSATPRNPHDLLARFLTDLGISAANLPEHTDDRAALYRAALAERRVLILLDNARDNAQITPLIPGTGQSVAIVTSRRTLASRTDALRIPLPPLGEEGRELLALLCGRERIAAEPESANRILTACGGLPLALRIAGARIASRPAWPLQTLARRLTEARELPYALAVDDLAVSDAFAMSYHALTGSTRQNEVAAGRAFRLLGLWPAHPLSLEAAAALLDLSLDHTTDALDILIDSHLLQSPAANAYRFHDLICGYVRELVRRAEPEEERAAATLRLLTWYAAAVHRAESLCRPQTAAPASAATTAPLPALRTAEDALAWLDREMPAIKEVVRRAAGSSRPHLAWEVAAMLTGHGDSCRWDGQWTEIVADALATAEAHGDLDAQANLRNSLASAHGQARRNGERLEHLNATR
ncbi:BTAD domain-containing putative transcriptional regulator [Streptomyces sp. NPDC047718]|uniref:AfsR/SARP family transcriptional regulator n=1 Tax=Streptomyces sp. NPDC047718 TaxID=3155479 RepID=UPI0033FDCB03